MTLADKLIKAKTALDVLNKAVDAFSLAMVDVRDDLSSDPSLKEIARRGWRRVFDLDVTTDCLGLYIDKLIEAPTEEKDNE